MFRECFTFNCKINFRKVTFFLAAIVSITFSVISQLPYFEHYQLTNSTDIQKINDRLWVDATIPTNGEEQILLTIDAVRNVLNAELKLQNSSDIITNLRKRLSVKNDWTVSELDSLWAELTSEYDELQMLRPNHLFNSFLNNFRKTVLQDELLRYAYSENDFSDYLSVEFGQLLSLIISILFVIFFSTIFLDDVKRGISDILHVNVISPRKMIYAKYLSALVMVIGCIGLNIIGVNIMQLIYVKDVSFEQLLTVWGNTLLYCIPTVVFISTASVLLCVLFKSAILGVAVLVLANFVSSIPQVFPNGMRRQLPIAPFVFNLNSFFDPISQNEFIAILLNRAAFCFIGVAMLELTVLVWKKHRSTSSIRRIPKSKVFGTSLSLPQNFFFYNSKIILNKVKFAALFVIFSMPYFSINANTEITNISRSILLMTGWASVILFSNIKSVEYSDATIDLYRLSAKGGLAVGVRFLICAIITVLFTSAVFFLSLLRIDPMTYKFEFVADIFTRMVVSCITCSCFLGSVTMTIGSVLKRTWTGLAFGLIISVLLSQIKTASILNLYLFYYLPGNENHQQWLVSILFYALISFAILLYNIFCSEKTFRFSKV